MTEKRFELSKSDIKDFRIYDYAKEDAYFIDCDKHTGSCLVSLLNQLNDENEKLKQQSDNKQKHIVTLENKIGRMREAIHKLEWLSTHRNADLQRENRQLKHQNELLSDELEQCRAVIDNRWSEYLQKKELRE